MYVQGPGGRPLHRTGSRTKADDSFVNRSQAWLTRALSMPLKNVFSLMRRLCANSGPEHHRTSRLATRIRNGNEATMDSPGRGTGPARHTTWATRSAI